MVRKVHLELTNYCNLNCVMCPVPEMKRAPCQMSFDLIKKIVLDNPEVKSYGLTNWGEPLLHPELVEIISFLKNFGKTVFLVTNATLLSEETSLKLIESGLDVLSFSVDAVGRSYEKIRGFNYRQLQRNILKFLDLNNGKVKTKIVATVFKDNEHCIKDVLEYWRNIIPVATQPKLTFLTSSVPEEVRRCPELYDGHFIVLSNGLVVPCCADYEGLLIVGDIRKETFTQISNGEPLNKLKRHGCGYCTEFQTVLTQPRFQPETKIRRLLSWLKTSMF